MRKGSRVIQYLVQLRRLRRLNGLTGSCTFSRTIAEFSGVLEILCHSSNNNQKGMTYVCGRPDAGISSSVK